MKKEFTASGKRAIIKTEAEGRVDFVRELRKRIPSAVVMRHEDIFAAGVPDISISARRRTIWIEAKRGDAPLTGMQAENIRRLDGYVVRFRAGRTAEIEGIGTFVSLRDAVDYFAFALGME